MEIEKTKTTKYITFKTDIIKVAGSAAVVQPGLSKLYQLFSNLNKIQELTGGSWRQKGDVTDMPWLMSAIHVVLVLGTCATATLNIMIM